MTRSELVEEIEAHRAFREEGMNVALVREFLLSLSDDDLKKMLEDERRVISLKKQSLVT